jgi:hypothetical protein
MTPITCQIESTSLLSHLLLMREVVMFLAGLLYLMCGSLCERHTKCISYRKCCEFDESAAGIIGPLFLRPLIDTSMLHNENTF